MTHVARRWGVALIGVVAGIAGSGALALASADTQPVAAPFVELDRYSFRPGAQVQVTIGGFTSRTVTVSVCGNEARRGSSDCNMPESEGVGVDTAGEIEVAEMAIGEPPVPCPCIIRAASPNNDEIAIADITLIGHPTGPLSDGAEFQQPLAVTVRAEPSSAGWGWLRSSLGGATDYEVEITIRNRATFEVDALAVTGTAGGGDGDVDVNLEVPQPGPIEPGGTWQQTIDTRLPAPVWGDARWEVAVAGAGATVVAADDTSHLPGLLLVVIALFVLDAALLVIRWARRRAARARLRAGRRRAQVPLASDSGSRDPATDGVAAEPELVA